MVHAFPLSAGTSMDARKRRPRLREGLASSILVLLFSISLVRHVAAEDLAMPAQLEASLSGNVAAYDRTLVERAGDKVVIVIVARSSFLCHLSSALKPCQ